MSLIRCHWARKPGPGDDLAAISCLILVLAPVDLHGGVALADFQGDVAVVEQADFVADKQAREQVQA